MELAAETDGRRTELISSNKLQEMLCCYNAFGRRVGVDQKTNELTVAGETMLRVIDRIDELPQFRDLTGSYEQRMKNMREGVAAYNIAHSIQGEPASSDEDLVHDARLCAISSVILATANRVERRRPITDQEIKESGLRETEVYIGELIGTAMAGTEAERTAILIGDGFSADVLSDLIKTADARRQKIIAPEYEKPTWKQAVKDYLKYLTEKATFWIRPWSDEERPMSPKLAKRLELYDKYRKEMDKLMPHEKLDPEKVGKIFLWIGIGRKKEDYAEIAEGFKQQGIECVCVDWPSFDKENFNFDQHPDFMMKILEEHGVGKDEKVGMIGHSRGGLAVLKFAKMHPEKLAWAHVASAPAGLGPERVPESLRHVIDAVFNASPAAVEMILKGLDLLPINAETKAFLRDNDPRRLTACYKDHIEQDWQQTVRDIPSMDIPMVFTWGGQDTIMQVVGNRAPWIMSGIVRLVDPMHGHKLPENEDLFRIVAYLVKKKEERELSLKTTPVGQAS